MHLTRSSAATLIAVALLVGALYACVDYPSSVSSASSVASGPKAFLSRRPLPPAVNAEQAWIRQFHSSSLMDFARTHKQLKATRRRVPTAQLCQAASAAIDQVLSVAERHYNAKPTEGQRQALRSALFQKSRACGHSLTMLSTGQSRESRLMSLFAGTTPRSTSKPARTDPVCPEEPCITDDVDAPFAQIADGVDEISSHTDEKDTGAYGTLMGNVLASWSGLGTDDFDMLLDADGVRSGSESDWVDLVAEIMGDYEPPQSLFAPSRIALVERPNCEGFWNYARCSADIFLRGIGADVVGCVGGIGAAKAPVPSSRYVTGYRMGS
jgi:hypothetical protein